MWEDRNQSFHCIYIFPDAATRATERKRRKHCHGEFGSGTSTIMSHCSPKAITTVTAPVREDNIRQGQGTRLHPKWAHVLQIASPRKERVLEWLNLAACVAAQHTVSKGKSQMTLSVSPLLLQETLLWSFKMKQGSSAHGPLGTSCCWQSSRPAVAKLAFQDEMVNVAAFCHWEGDGEGGCSRWFQGTICLWWEWEVADLQGLRDKWGHR